MSYEKIFEPGKIGKCKIKNRIIMASMEISIWLTRRKTAAEDD